MYVEFPRPSGIRCAHNVAQNSQRRVGRWTWQSHSYENCFICCAPLQSLHVECSTLPMIFISVESQPDAVILTIELISLILLIQ